MLHNASSKSLEGLIELMGQEETSHNANTLVSIVYSVLRDNASTKKPACMIKITMINTKIARLYTYIAIKFGYFLKRLDYFKF